MISCLVKSKVCDIRGEVRKWKREKREEKESIESLGLSNLTFFYLFTYYFDIKLGLAVGLIF